MIGTPASKPVAGQQLIGDAAFTGGIPITQGDVLIASYWASQRVAGIEVSLHARCIAADGSLVRIERRAKVAGVTATSTLVVPLLKGQLSYATFNCTANSVYHGELFCQLAVSYLETRDAASLLQLASGYATLERGISYPTPPSKSGTTDRPPFLWRSYASPPAGQDLGIIFNLDQSREFRTISFDLTTSAAIASRRVKLAFSNSSNGVIWLVSRTNQLASNTYHYQVWCGAPVPADVAPFIYLQAPFVEFAEDGQIATSIDSLQAADQLSLIYALSAEQISAPNA